jgi:AraC-like DNA-binding protein
MHGLLELSSKVHRTDPAGLTADVLKRLPGTRVEFTSPKGEAQQSSILYAPLRSVLFELWHSSGRLNLVQHGGPEHLSMKFQLSGAFAMSPLGTVKHEDVADTGKLMTFVGPDDLTAGLEADSLRFRLIMPPALLASKFERLLERPVSRLLFDSVIDLGSGRAKAVLEHAAAIFMELNSRDQDPADALWYRELEEQLLSQIVLGIPHSHSDLLRQPVSMPAPRTVRRAEEYIRANAMSALSIEEIASAAGCSARALQKAFRHFREMTPMAYLRRYRYDVARDRLASGSIESIHQLSRELGFSNAGRFASEFKAQFGRSPKDFIKG